MSLKGASVYAEPGDTAAVTGERGSGTPGTQRRERAGQAGTHKLVV